jgi:cyclopropane-fatty-acyl-phospholipid synthase
VTSDQTTQHLDRRIRLLLAIARRIRRGSITIHTPDGGQHLFEGAEGGTHAVIRVIKPGAVRRLLFGGDVGFAEAYMAGEVDSPDIGAVVRLAIENERALDDALTGGPVMRFGRRIWHRLRGNTRRGSRRNIAYHYDLGNAFYSRWLDDSMTYSSAVFGAPDQDLTEAQRNKYRNICELLALEPGHRVLEIGCGWGGFAEHAAREHGVHVTGITLSREQHDYARRRIDRAGLSNQVEIRLQDYRDVTGTFDRVASIEMFEAVGERYWRAYFDKISEVLARGGRAALQIITIADERFEAYRRNPDFIQRYIFPGGMLPSPGALRRVVEETGLTWSRDAGFALDYARTLALWRDRFLQAWPELTRQGFDERFRRMWTYYLAYCESGFQSGLIDVKQIEIKRGG